MGCLAPMHPLALYCSRACFPARTWAQLRRFPCNSTQRQYSNKIIEMKQLGVLHRCASLRKCSFNNAITSFQASINLGEASHFQTTTTYDCKHHAYKEIHPQLQAKCKQGRGRRRSKQVSITSKILL